MLKVIDADSSKNGDRYLTLCDGCIVVARSYLDNNNFVVENRAGNGKANIEMSPILIPARDKCDLLIGRPSPPLASHWPPGVTPGVPGEMSHTVMSSNFPVCRFYNKQLQHLIRNMRGSYLSYCLDIILSYKRLCFIYPLNQISIR